MFIIDLCKKLEQNKVAYAIAGGYAVALHGFARGTMDIDLVLKIDIKNFENAIKTFTQLGLKSQLPLKHEDVINYRKEYIENRNLIAWNFTDPKDPSHIVDIILTHDLNKMKITKKIFGKTTLNVISLEDLIQMKKESGRPQDLEDIKALKDLKNE